MSHQYFCSIFRKKKTKFICPPKACPHSLAEHCLKSNRLKATNHLFVISQAVKSLTFIIIYLKIIYNCKQNNV